MNHMNKQKNRNHNSRHFFVFSLLFIVVALLFLQTDAAVRNDVPIWPHPTTFNDDTASAFHICIPNGPSSLKFQVSAPDSTETNQQQLDILQRAVERYKREIFTEYYRESHTYERLKNGRIDLWRTKEQQVNATREDLLKNRVYPYGNSMTAKIEVADANQALQLEGMDESYTLEVVPVEKERERKGTLRVVEYEIKVKAEQVWGVLRALESLSQLVQFNLDRDDHTVVSKDAGDSAVDTRCMYKIQNIPVTIEDGPRYPWRGLMIDSARHFLPVSLIKRILDGMTATKLNVLHWHLTDAQSFPFFVAAFPLLSQKGRYADHLHYSTEDLKDIVQYATDRGIRIVPELDMPGHAFSWGLGYPELTVQCETENINNIPLDPTSEFLYEVIEGIVDEFRKVFPDSHIHFGADELAAFCWESNERIAKFMKDNDMKVGLWGHFQNRLQKIYTAEKYSKDGRKIVPVFWQEIFTSLDTTRFSLDKDAILTAWSSDNPSIENITSEGYKALFNEAWYLDKQKPYGEAKKHWLFYDTWEDMYLAEPTKQLKEGNPDLILGGEACMWSEQIDIHSVESRIFPRASAAAERLWSPKTINKVKPARDRIIHHACNHLARKGVRSNTIRPDYCPHTYVNVEKPFLTPLGIATVAVISVLGLSTVALLCLFISSCAAAMYLYKKLGGTDRYGSLNYTL